MGTPASEEMKDYAEGTDKAAEAAPVTEATEAAAPAPVTEEAPAQAEEETKTETN